MKLPTHINALVFTLGQQAQTLQRLADSLQIVPFELKQKLDDHAKTFKHLENLLEAEPLSELADELIIRTIELDKSARRLSESMKAEK